MSIGEAIAAVTNDEARVERDSHSRERTRNWKIDLRECVHVAGRSVRGDQTIRLMRTASREKSAGRWIKCQSREAPKRQRNFAIANVLPRGWHNKRVLIAFTFFSSGFLSFLLDSPPARNQRSDVPAAIPRSNQLNGLSPGTETPGV